MDPNTRALLMGSAAAGTAAKVYVEDVFSTWLYTGNSSTQAITNGIDLSGKGGLVWCKARSAAYRHELVDTARGGGNKIESQSSFAQDTGGSDIAGFTSSGFTLGNVSGEVNFSGTINTSWTFRKAAKFFDVVTYTGTGTNRTISHNLGSVPGCIIVKRTDTTGDWQVYHRSLANTEYLVLNSTAAKATGTTRWNSTTPTSTEFSLGTDATVNANAGTYVAYLFAHDAGGFGDSGNESVVKCGSFTTDGSGNATVNLGWEPQFLTVKASSTTGNWQIIDQMRGMSYSDGSVLRANLANAEASLIYAQPTSTGFTYNEASSTTYIYIAIRRGPMKTPTDATKVFQAKLYTGTNTDNRLVTTDIVTDMAWVRRRADGTTDGMNVGDRLRGQPYFVTGTGLPQVDDADAFDRQMVSAVEYGTAWSSMTGFWVGNDATASMNANTTSNGHVALAFRRAPGFFDILRYTGNASTQVVYHNLTVAPELIFFKSTAQDTSWRVAKDTSSELFLNLANAQYANSIVSAFAADSITLTNDTSNNGSGFFYIAYLFASCPGVSKVGSYTGSGTTKDIDCGFAAGARLVIIKRTDSTGDWYLWDTARGITTGNDPYRLLNENGNDVESTDYIDPLSSGFQITSTAPAAINANGGTYIYLAIA